MKEGQEMIIDKKCFGKWMWRKNFFGVKQKFKPLHIIEGRDIMGEKVVGLDGGRMVGFGFYYYVKMFPPNLDDWHFLNKEDYCVYKDKK